MRGSEGEWSDYRSLLMITEPRPRLIPGWVTIYILSFFSLALIGINIRQISPISHILLLDWSFEKTQLQRTLAVKLLI